MHIKNVFAIKYTILNKHKISSREKRINIFFFSIRLLQLRLQWKKYGLALSNTDAIFSGIFGPGAVLQLTSNQILSVPLLAVTRLLAYHTQLHTNIIKVTIPYFQTGKHEQLYFLSLYLFALLLFNWCHFRLLSPKTCRKFLNKSLQLVHL